ncbi:hypothetical protein [Ottowia sp.]|uniref:ADP-ribosyltransferase-containing protein n=1 Tax=Ottowia sp. TaxID=1898956 RepID=UPI0025E1EDD6|nr:hypothetical protein [Ottowia sp.]MBK6615916.1 hypothetical protein [Ottowia sp.]
MLPENAGKTFGDYLDARPNAALQTAIATAVGGGAQVATVKAAGWAVNRADYQAEKARQAEQHAQVLAELNTLAQANKVLQRSPETFQEFVAKAAEDGPLQSVYIDGQTLMQSGLAEQVAAISPAVAEQVQQAAQTGGAVAIPVDEYAARIAPTDLAQQLQPHLRTEADGFSQAEAQQYMQSQGEQLQADLDRAVADSQQGDAFRASADVVTGQIRQQLDRAARFRPEVNDAYSRVVGAYFATRAAQLGVTPEALFERRMLTVGAESVLGGDVLNQALASQPPKGWVHVTSGEEAAQMWEGEGAQAVFWTDLGGKLAQDVPGLAGYSHSLGRSTADHVRKNHGDSKAEASRGQIAVTAEDLGRVPEIVTGYDAIRTDLRSDQGAQRIAYAKRYPDALVVYVEDVSRKRSDMRGVTMWKLQPSNDPQAALDKGLDVEAGKDKGPANAGPEGDALRPLSDYESDAQTPSPGPNLPDQGGSYNQGANQTDTPEFRAWFGDSKVVDAEGKPLVVYHGTSSDITAFDPSKTKAADVIFTTPDPAGASLYAETQSTGAPNVMPLYVSIRRPAYIQANEYSFEALQAAVSRGDVDGVLVVDGEGRIKIAAPLYPEQIKSAIGNNGNFDPADPNILHQGAWHGTPHRGIEKTGFKLNKIGTGEGAQAYGWGMYFASAREVADGYRISLSSQAGHAPSIRGRSVISYYDAAEREGSRGGPLGYDKAALLERLMLHDSPQQVIAHGRDPDSGISPEAVAWFEREVAPHFKAGGQLYQAEIPEDSDLLDWDKPLSEQPEKLREALAQAREFAEAAEQPGGIGIRRVDDGVLAGAGLYGAIERATGSPKAASEYLQSIGIPGLRYLDGNSRASGEGSANYVIWDEALLTPEAARIEAVYNQGPRAAFNPERLAITLLGGADLSSFLHESGHFFFENDIALASEIVAAQRQGASITPGEQQMLADVGQLLTWHGLKGDVAAQLTEWHNMPFEEKRALHERTAESFEAYLFEGKAPSIELAPYFQRFRSWLLRVYTSLKDFLAGHPEAGTLTPEVRAVFDRMLATNDAIVQAEQGRSMLALFESAEQGGMAPEAWAAYQAQGGAGHAGCGAGAAGARPARFAMVEGGALARAEEAAARSQGGA